MNHLVLVVGLLGLGLAAGACSAESNEPLRESLEDSSVSSSATEGTPAPELSSLPLSPTPTGTRSTPIEKGSGILTASSTAVRAGPDERYPIVGYLNLGDAVTVIGSHGIRFSLPSGIRWLALDRLGWIEYESAAIELDFDVERLYGPNPYPVGPTYDVAPGTGIAMVDQVVEAVVVDDLDSLAPLLRFQERACTHEAAYPQDPPLCPDGLTEGTGILVLPIGANGEFGWASGAQDGAGTELLDYFLASEPPEPQPNPWHLYAVARAEDFAKFKRDYWIVFGNDGGYGRAIAVDASGITYLSRGDGGPPSAFLIDVGETDFVVPPLTPPGLSGMP
jgi:hypothetical protein